MAEKVKGLHVEINGDVSGLRKSLYEMEKEMHQSEQALKSINKALKLDPTNVDLLTKKQDVLKQSISDLQLSLNREKEAMEKLDSEGANPLSKEYVQLQARITELTKRIKEQVDALTVLSPKMQSCLEKMESLGGGLERLGQKSRLFSTAMKGVVSASTEASIQYEENIASIKKVIKDLSDDTVESLKQMATETGTTFSDLSTYATIAGTLGLAEKDIVSFVGVMNDLNTATDGSIFGEEGSKKVARFMNVMGEDMGDVGRFGSGLVYVSDQFAATADEVLEVATGLSGLGVLAGVTSGDLVGLAANLKNLGVGTAVASSSVQKVMLQIEKEVATGGKNLEKFADVAQMEAENFARYWSESPVKAFLRFVDGLKSDTINEIDDAIMNQSKDLDHYADALGMTREQFIKAWNEDDLKVLQMYADATENMDEETESASKTLNDLKITSVRVLGTMLKLAGHGNDIAHAVEDFNDAWDANVALGNKANTMYETTSRRIKGAKEALQQAGAALGDVYMPVIELATDKVRDFSKWLKELDPTAKKFIATMTLAGAGLSPVAIGLGKLLKSTSGIGKNLGVFVSKMKIATNYAGFKDFAHASVVAGEGLNVFEKQLGKTLFSLEKFAYANSTLLAGGAFLATGALAAKYLVTKEIVEGNIEAFEELDKQLKSLGETSEERFRDNLIGIEQADRYEYALEGLVEEVGKTKKGSEEYSEAVNKVKENVDLLNESLGGNFVYYDEETNELKTVEDQAKLTAEAYEKLVKEQKKQAWLEAHKDQYIEAINSIEEYQKIENDAWKKALDAEKKLTEEEKKQLDQMKVWEEGKVLTNAKALNYGNLGYSKEVLDAYREYVEALETVSNNEQFTEGAKEIIHTFELMGNLNPDRAVEFIDAWTVGVDLMSNNFHDYISQLQDGMDFAKYLEEQNTEASVDGAKRVREANSLLIKKLNDLGFAISSNGDIYDRKTGETVGHLENLVLTQEDVNYQIETTNQGIQITASNAEEAMESFNAFTENATSGMQNIKDDLDEINRTKLEDKEFTVTENRNIIQRVIDWGTSLFSGSTSRTAETVSRGLPQIEEGDIVPLTSMARVSAPAVDPTQFVYDVSGYNRGVANTNNYTYGNINVSMNVNNNGKEISQDVLRSWSKQVAKEVEDSITNSVRRRKMAYGQ